MEKVATRGVVMIFSPILRPSFLGVHESKDCRDREGWSTILGISCFIVPDAAHTCKWQFGWEFTLLGLALALGYCCPSTEGHGQRWYHT